MSTTETEIITDWALTDLEPEIYGLKATIGIFGHMIQSPFHVQESQWVKIEDDLNAYVDRIDALWKRAWDQLNATDAKHDAALAEAKAEAKAAEAEAGPLSGTRLEELLWLERMLRGMATMINSNLDNAPVGLVQAVSATPEREPAPEPEPQPERKRW